MLGLYKQIRLTRVCASALRGVLGFVEAIYRFCAMRLHASSHVQVSSDHYAWNIFCISSL